MPQNPKARSPLDKERATGGELSDEELEGVTGGSKCPPTPTPTKPVLPPKKEKVYDFTPNTLEGD